MMAVLSRLSPVDPRLKMLFFQSLTYSLHRQHETSGELTKDDSDDSSR